MSDNCAVSIFGCEEECVEVILDQYCDTPIVLYVSGPPGPVATGAKSGVISGDDFTGSPKKVTVAFDTDYPDDNYSILITGSASRSFTYENKTAAGFTINANASTAFTGDVSWFSLRQGG